MPETPQVDATKICVLTHLLRRSDSKVHDVDFNFIRKYEA
jgi:hypothetical protein